jgi:uncharacterized integral membrane protein
MGRHERPLFFWRECSRGCSDALRCLQSQRPAGTQCVAPGTDGIQYMRVIGWLFGAAYFVAVLMFALKNSTLVPVRFSNTIVWNDVPLVVLILSCFFAGVIAGWFAWVPQVLKLRRQFAVLERKSHRANTLDLADRRTDRLADAARNAGAIGDLDADTRTPTRKLTGF